MHWYTLVFAVIAYVMTAHVVFVAAERLCLDLPKAFIAIFWPLTLTVLLASKILTAIFVRIPSKIVRRAFRAYDELREKPGAMPERGPYRSGGDGG